MVGIGIDAGHVDGVRRLLERRPGTASRLFTEQERACGARGRDGDVEVPAAASGAPSRTDGRAHAVAVAL